MKKLVKKLLVKGWGLPIIKKLSKIPKEDLCECCNKREKGEGLKKLCIVCFEREGGVIKEHTIRIG